MTSNPRPPSTLSLSAVVTRISFGRNFFFFSSSPFFFSSTLFESVDAGLSFGRIFFFFLSLVEGRESTVSSNPKPAPSLSLSFPTGVEGEGFVPILFLLSSSPSFLFPSIHGDSGRIFFFFFPLPSAMDGDSTISPNPKPTSSSSLSSIVVGVSFGTNNFLAELALRFIAGVNAEHRERPFFGAVAAATATGSSPLRFLSRRPNSKAKRILASFD
mmetsp:Transcript_16502/g.29839  ORF Transcript_16502/g.29839 Transcript_16502/m.29839 type:complete len:215 (-) Transcript_16502:562-1206(-)